MMHDERMRPSRVELEKRSIAVRRSFYQLRLRGYTYREIGEIMGVSGEAARRRVKRYESDMRWLARMDEEGLVADVVSYNAAIDAWTPWGRRWWTISSSRSKISLSSSFESLHRSTPTILLSAAAASCAILPPLLFT